MYLLDIVRHRRHIESTFLVTDGSRLAEMLPSTRMQPSVDRGNIIQMRSMMRILKLLELDTNAGNVVVPVEHGPEDHDMAEPQRPTKMSTKKSRPAWACDIIQDAEKYGAPDGSFRESKKPRPSSSNVALLYH